MPKIEFRGKTYRNEFEMPPEVREAYRREKERQAERNKSNADSLTDLVEMSPEVKAIYERALGNVEDNLPTRPSKNLPNTEDLYRQSAPDDMKDLPSDESIYRPSQPLIDQVKPAIEPESAFRMKRFISSIVWVLVLIAVAFLVLQSLP